jgi:small conductance mechanosensitive channel
MTRPITAAPIWALALLLIATFAFTSPATAQLGPPEAAAPAEPEPAPESAPEAPVEAPAEAAPPLAAALTDPAIAADELNLLLIPLTVDQLAALAGEWLAIVQAKTQEVVEAQIRINRTAAESVEQAARDRLTALTEERRALFDRYSRVVDAWELKGGDPAAIATFRTYRSSIIVEETRNTDWRTLVAQALAWTTARDGGVQIALNAGVVIASFLGLLVVAGLVRRIVRRSIGHVPNISRLLQAFVAVAAYWLTLAVGLMLVLAGLGVNITPLFALVGGASFIIAFAMQNTLGNLAAGLMIMINRPFDEGDHVDIGGVSGTVKDVSIMSTTVVKPDNQIVVVPNSSVWGNVITNSTVSETRRVDLEFAVSNETPIARAQAALESVVRAHPLVLPDPEPIIRVNALTDGAVKFVVRPWTRRDDYWTVYWDLTRAVKDALDRAGIAEPEEEATTAEPARRVAGRA